MSVNIGGNPISLQERACIETTYPTNDEYVNGGVLLVPEQKNFLVLYSRFSLQTTSRPVPQEPVQAIMAQVVSRYSGVANVVRNYGNPDGSLGCGA